MLKQDIQHSQGVLLDALHDVRHGASEVCAEEGEEGGHPLGGNALGHKAEEAHRGRTDGGVLVCEDGGQLAQDAGQVLVQEVGVEGQQLPQPDQRPLLHSTTVMVQLGQEVLKDTHQHILIGSTLYKLCQ